jgi:hypothetical protein
MMARNRWLVRLAGNESDLQALESLLASGPITVTREKGDEWYLSGQVFEGIEDPAAARDRGVEVAEIVNGVGVLFGLEKVAIGSTVSEVTEDGTRRNVVFVAESIAVHVRVNAVVLGPDGKPKEDENALAFRRTLNLALNEKGVRDALHFLAQQQNWYNLYKVFEVVQDDVHKGVWNLVDETMLRSFKGTAQSRRLLGDEARHASRRKKYYGPPNPVSLEDARRLMRQLV